MYAKYKKNLPATPCTEEMRDKMIAYSRAKGQSVSETNRQAIAFFFAQIGQKLTKDDYQNDQKESQDER